MSLPRYLEYKSCPVAWLGEVPTHWTTVSIRRLATIGMGQTILREMLEDAPCEGSVPVYSASEGDEPFGYFRNPSIRLSKGDLIVGARGSIGMARAVREEATCTQTTIWVKLASHKLYPDYAYWVFVGGREALFPFDKTAIPMLTVEQVASGNVPLPPAKEQALIATFLDRETGKIDALIAEQEKLLTLLVEKRQATISHAVTKGLNPDVPLKDSGVAWLGEVPMHWELKQLKHVARQGTAITYGIVQAGPHVEGGIPYIKTSDMAGDSLPTEGYACTTPEIDQSYSRSKVAAGDLVIAIRATVGKCLPVPQELDGANLTQGTAKIAPGDSVTSGFLLAAIRANASQTYFDSMAKGATFKEITIDALRRTPLAIPPFDEQVAITQFVEQEAGRLDALLLEAKRSIELLKERRSALIAAAVTGQIDVRGLVTEPEAA